MHAKRQDAIFLLAVSLVFTVATAFCAIETIRWVGPENFPLLFLLFGGPAAATLQSLIAWSIIALTRGGSDDAHERLRFAAMLLPVVTASISLMGWLFIL